MNGDGPPPPGFVPTNEPPQQPLVAPAQHPNQYPPPNQTQDPNILHQQQMQQQQQQVLLQQQQLPGYPVGPPPQYTGSMGHPVAGGVVVAQPNGMLPPRAIYSHNPQIAFCATCNTNVMTEVEYYSGMLVWLVAGGLCLVGCGCFACLPCFIDSFKDVSHSCPTCKSVLGRHNPV